MSTQTAKDFPNQLPNESQTIAESSLHRLREITEMLDEANRWAVFGRLMPGIAHNINNSLAVIFGHIQLYKFKHPGFKEMDIIQEQAHQIKNIIGYLSRKASGEASIQKSSINICKLLENELNLLTADPFYKHEVKKTIDLPKDTPCINGYYRDISFALLSIINFSLDSMMEADRKEFVLSVSSDDDYITINVSDTGKPLSGQQNEAPDLASVDYQSARIGKYIVNLAKTRDIIARYHGEMSLISNNPSGKKIQICFPKQHDQ